MPPQITSTSNPLVKSLVRLKDRKGRNAQGRFLIEGRRELGRAAEAGIVIEQMVIAPDLTTDADNALAADLAAAGVERIEVGPDPFARMSMRSHPDGLLGVAVPPERDLAALTVGPQALVLVVEAVEKPGNLGAMLRTADGAGVDAVIIVDPPTDLWNPNVIRASQGAVFAVSTATATAPAALEWIERHRLTTVAASPEAPRPLWDADLTAATAIVVGAEHTGLTPGFRSPETLVAIPMAGASDSLNASVAAALMLFEAVRQRRTAATFDSGR